MKNKSKKKLTFSLAALKVFQAAPKAVFHPNQKRQPSQTLQQGSGLECPLDHRPGQNRQNRWSRGVGKAFWWLRQLYGGPPPTDQDGQVSVTNAQSQPKDYVRRSNTIHFCKCAVFEFYRLVCYSWILPDFGPIWARKRLHTYREESFYFRHRTSTENQPFFVQLFAIFCKSLYSSFQRQIVTRLTYNCAHLRSTKEKKEENICRRKIFFAEGTMNGGGKGG